MSEASDRVIGRLEGEVQALQREMTELRADVKALLTAVATAKGGWKVLVAAASAGGAVGAFTMKAGTWFLSFPVK